MRKSSSNPNHHSKEIRFVEFEDMPEDEISRQFDTQSRLKSNQRKREARRKIERYKEDKELARWIRDYHFDQDG